MADSVYRVTEVIGVSSESWEAAARTAVETAAKTVFSAMIMPTPVRIWLVVKPASDNT